MLKLVWSKCESPASVCLEVSLSRVSWRVKEGAAVMVPVVAVSFLLPQMRWSARSWPRRSEVSVPSTVAVLSNCRLLSACSVCLSGCFSSSQFSAVDL